MPPTTRSRGAPRAARKARADRTARAGSAAGAGRRPGPSGVLAAVRGTCSSAPEVRVLPSGRRLAVLQVTARAARGGHAVSVPVAAWDPPGWVETLAPGDEVVAVGVVRRRFYRHGGATASRVEVEAEVLARGGDRRRVEAALRRARVGLDRLAGG